MTIKQKFDSVKGWTTQFNIDGVNYGGDVPILTNDPRLHWHIETIGGLKGKTVLELGPLEGAHTKTMIEAGASEVTAIEVNMNCWERCLIVKEVFGLDKATFHNLDFCYFVEHTSSMFDVVSAAGVLYHQKNPAQLIYDLARITDTVLVWSQVASRDHPSPFEGWVLGNGVYYSGKVNDYKGIKGSLDSYCAGPHDKSFWMYPGEMLRCFRDAGFVNIIQKESPPNINGESLLFVATK